MSSECQEIVSVTEQSDFRLLARLSLETDRYGHQLILSNSSHELCLLSSSEGDSQQEFPDSPPFQQLSVEPIQDQQVALLTGMAGQHHWSGSIEPQAEGLQLHFDIAAKMQQANLSDALRSTYRLLPGRNKDSLEPILSARGFEMNWMDQDLSAEIRLGIYPDRDSSWEAASMSEPVAPREGEFTAGRRQSGLGSRIGYAAENAQIWIRPSQESNHQTNPVRWFYSIRVEVAALDQN